MHPNKSKGVVSNVIDLKCDLKSANYRRKSPNNNFVFGGLFSDSELAWLYNGPFLKVINVKNGRIQSSWDFSEITNDSKTEITSVTEYPMHESRSSNKEDHLYVIISYVSKRDSRRSSFISFCHPRTSKVIYTLTTGDKVTSVCLISGKRDHASPISGVVKEMKGSLALGTQSGQILIVDTKEIFCYVRRNAYDPVRNRFGEISILELRRHSDNEIKDKINNEDDESCHIAVALSDKKDSREHTSEICTLFYIQQNTTLAVGFKNGTFQLWDINSLKKLYKSPCLEVPTPIVAFGFQEPCNDPQNVCYLWVIYESESEKPACLPFAVMYGLHYKRISTISDYGRHYKNFIHCRKRFDLDVELERCIGGKCVSSSVVSNTPSNILRHTSAGDEDPSKINLFVVIFETWERDADETSCISMVVFDMNQWYKAQMPYQCYLGYTTTPFINFTVLDRVSERKSSILDVHIKRDSIQQFLTFNLSEEYSYPSSLSFDTVILSDSKIIQLRVLGAQRNVLERIISEGPSGLINPSKYYTECKEAGLRPSFWDSCVNAIVPSQTQQRNYVLTILLEHKVSSFLVRCVKEWADGSRGVSGCTLPNLIQWGWECITRIKQQTDVICVPLFDYSGDDLDRENYQKLKHCCCLMRIIRDLLNYISSNYKQYLLDESKLKHQINTLQLVTKYFDVIIWCLDCGLLPEKVAGSSDKCVPIYLASILQYTDQRREELKMIASNDKYFLLQNSILYLIDAMFDNEAKGRKLQMQWQRESGGTTTGLYPPVTLQSLLRMYLLPDLSIDVKNFSMIYFLLDVCDYHRDEDMKEQLLSFSVVFSIDSLFFAFVQICWLVDHERFEEAADVFTVENISPLLQSKPRLYKTLLQACVGQGQYSLALRFERLVNLATSVFDNERFYIMLLLQNGLVTEAYSTLKESYFNRKLLLQHFFKVCDDFGLLKEIFKFPLSREEEEEFMTYLDECKNKDAGDLKIMYLLSRARYVEAIDVNRNLGSIVPKFSVVGHETTKQNAKIGRTTTRDMLVNAFAKTLPSVTNDLITFCRNERDKIYRFKEVKKPTPLSVVVHTDISQPIPVYKSSFESVLQAAISKTAETWHKFPTISGSSKLNRSMLKDTPFLRSSLLRSRDEKTSSLGDGETIIADESKSPNEPPRKRTRMSIAATPFEKTRVEIDEESIDSPLLEVSDILRTPHVQKKFNKLLQNTPELSPLTSILKSSEISRFKQPQKVGFSVPEVSGRTPTKVSVAVEVHETPRNTKDSKETAVRKKLTEKFEPSTEKIAVCDNNSLSSLSTRSATATPTNESANTVENTDSYYSLGNEDDDEDNAVYAKLANVEPLHSQKDSENANVRHFVESMSEDEISDNRRERLIMEVMSEEESVTGAKSFDLIQARQSIEIRVESEKVQNVNVPDRNAQHDMPAAETVFNDFREETKKNEQNFATNVNEQRSASQCDLIGVRENESPKVSLESYGNESMISESIMTSSDVPNVVPVFSSTNELFGLPLYEPEKIVTESSNLSGFASAMKANETRFSLESYECVESMLSRSEMRVNESASAAEVEPAQTVEEDSDIEILDDEATSSSKSENTDDETTNEDDRSEYSSSPSGSDEANIVDNVSTLVNDDDDRDTEELNELDEQSEIGSEELEEEEIGEGIELMDEREEEIDIVCEDDVEEGNDVGLVVDEEGKEVDSHDDKENSGESLDEEEEAEAKTEGDNDSNREIATESSEFDPNIIYRNNPDINYEELKNIMSTVAAADTQPCENINVENTEAVAEPSIVEIYDLDMTRTQTSIVENDSSKAEISVEFLSVSAVDKATGECDANKSAEEPSMKFYFGENSVTSITDDVLVKNKDTISPTAAEGMQLEGAKEANTTFETNDGVRAPSRAGCETESAVDRDKNTEVTSPSANLSPVSNLTPQRLNLSPGSNLTPQRLEFGRRSMDGDFFTQHATPVDVNAVFELQEEPDLAPSVRCESERSSIQQPVFESPPKDSTIAESVQSPNTSQIVVSVDLHEAPPQNEAIQPVAVFSEKSYSAEPAPAVELQTNQVPSSPRASPMRSPGSFICTPPKKRLSPRISEALASPTTQTTPPHTRETTPTHSPIKQTPVVSPSKESPVKETPTESVVSASVGGDVEHPEEQAAAPTPRRSLRIRRYSVEPDFEYQLPTRRSSRRSVDRQLPDDAASDTTSASPSRPSSRSSRRLSVDDDDAASIKSGCSAADSVSSRASVTPTQPQSRKRSSFSRLEMRKSSTKPQLRKLEVIMSDEEETPSQANRSGQSAPAIVISRPGDEFPETKSVKESEDEDRLSVASETRSTRSKRRKLDPSHEGSIASPGSVPKKQKKLVCSTPMKAESASQSPIDSETVYNYASSRRLTRSQKSLLQYGIQRSKNNDEEIVDERLSTAVHRLEDVPEEGSSYDSNNDFPEGSLHIDMDENQTIVEANETRDVDPITAVVNSTAKQQTGASQPIHSSDESSCSKKSTNSRRRNRPSTYSSIELRKSSNRRSLKPLAVISSDEESMAFQTPLRRAQVEDDSVVSSPETTPTKRVMPKRITRSSRRESDVSDRESTVSDVSSVSSATATKKPRKKMSETSNSPDKTRSKRQKSTAIVTPRRESTRRKK